MDRPSPNFFSRTGVGQDDRTHLEAQQALLVELLRRAGGAPITYDELRDRGIDLPASVVSELELAGFPIERCYRAAGGSRQLGVRMDPSRDPLRPFPETPARTTDARTPAPVAPAPHDRIRTRSLAPVAVAAVAILAIVLAVTTLGSGGTGRHPVVHRAPRGAASAKKPTRRITEAAVTPSPPAPVSASQATQLEAQGHDLLQVGDYKSAVNMLRRAVAATGEEIAACSEPVSQSCLTYAYALYDLGRALRLSGDLAAAVPVLEQRLQIDNQRAVVLTELALARSSAPTTQPR